MLEFPIRSTPQRTRHVVGLGQLATEVDRDPGEHEIPRITDTLERELEDSSRHSSRYVV